VQEVFSSDCKKQTDLGVCLDHQGLLEDQFCRKTLEIQRKLEGRLEGSYERRQPDLVGPARQIQFPFCDFELRQEVSATVVGLGNGAMQTHDIAQTEQTV